MNNRAENSHYPLRRREWKMQGFKSVNSAQRFASVKGEVLDVLAQSKRNKHAALKLTRKILKKYAFAPKRFGAQRLSVIRPSGPRSRHRAPA